MPDAQHAEEYPPQAVIIAGPNGSGKSTCAVLLLQDTMHFVNADMIAQEMTGIVGTIADIGAGRVLLGHLDELTETRKDFAIETTLATKTLADRACLWREQGYQVHLIFLYLPSEDLAVQRVAFRVMNGGHDVPEKTIRRRFRVGLRNLFRIYTPVVDTWRVYDNSKGFDPELIASGAMGQVRKVLNPELWRSLRAEYGDE
jgi:predicted ABC-type ATPase